MSHKLAGGATAEGVLMTKSHAQLNREIAETLAKPHPKQRTVRDRAAARSGALSREAVEHYMGGGCDAFAVALHREYGLQPVAVRGYYYAPDGSVQFETPHVAAMMPAGDVVDAAGVRSPSAMLDADWPFEHAVFDVRLEPISAQEAATTFGRRPSQAEIKRARKMARRIFE
jgi:hypothetical protein